MPFALSLALRDLRGAFRGFAVFLACIALGVAAVIAGGADDSPGLQMIGVVLVVGAVVWAVRTARRRT